jgi:Transposase zinc-ribbon domain
MPVLSYLHQLFNVDQCQAYIHTLRWKDRPLQCPRCQSQDIDPWGTYHYRPGWGIHVKRDTQLSIAYSQELVFSMSVTLQSTDRHHGIVGQEHCHFQRDS